MGFSALLLSCGHSANDYNHVYDFENGVAIANLKPTDQKGGTTLLINEKYKPVSRPFYHLFSLKNGYWYGVNSSWDTITLINPQLQEYLQLTDMSLEGNCNQNKSIWARDKDKNLMLISILDGSVLSNKYENTQIEQNLPGGTVVLRHYLHGGIHKLWDYAIVDSTGHELAPLGKYKFVGDFHNGLARFSTSGYGKPKPLHEDEKDYAVTDKWGSGARLDPTLLQGYINENGEVVIPEKYMHAEDFKDDGTARVGNYKYKKLTDSHRIDRNGNKVEK